MPAYIIVEIEILDPVGYEEYKKLAGATVEKYGGKYIVRGGKAEVLEGDWQPKRIVSWGETELSSRLSLTSVCVLLLFQKASLARSFHVCAHVVFRRCRFPRRIPFMLLQEGGNVRISVMLYRRG